MLSIDADDSTFKLFGKFGFDHLQQEIRQQFHDQTENTNRSNDTPSNRAQRRRWQTCACLLFSILSGLLAGLFNIEHLSNLLSIGTLLMLFALTVDIMILRCSTHLQQKLQRPKENGTTHTVTKSSRSINLVTILLSAYCLLAATLAIMIRILISESMAISPIFSWTLISILIVGLVAIVFVLGAKPRGNAMFSLSFLHPLIPATILFACIFLFTAVDVAAWIRIAVWMTIGLLFYFFVKKSNIPQTSTNGFDNNGFYAENDLDRNNHPDNMTSSMQSLKFDNKLERQATILNLPPNNTASQPAASNNFELNRVQFELDDVTKRPTGAFNAPPNAVFTEIKTVQSPAVFRKTHLDSSKLNEIASVEDIRHLCVERREPNGTAYFVEMTSFQNAAAKEPNDDELLTKSADKSPEISDDELEQNIVERVLQQSDIEVKPKPIPEPPRPVFVLPPPSENEDTESEEEKEVRAIVHASNGRASPFEHMSLTGTAPGVIRPIDPTGKHTNSLRAPNFQIGMYEALPKQKLLYENDKDRLAFKMRLENLFGQNDEPLTIRAKSNFNSPTTTHSLRLKTLNHSKSAPESLLDEVIVNDAAPIPVDSIHIPAPPVFNKELYDTVGRRNNRKAFSSASDVIDINGTINDHTPSEGVNKMGNLSRTKAHENLAELATEHDDGTGIKLKLEEIFSKGQKPNESTNLDICNNNNRENIRRSKRLEPFDTVRKQKMLFSDVLKSIGPDIHANLHATNTTAAVDIQQAQRHDSLD